MTELYHKNCEPCPEGAEALSQESQKRFLNELSSGWKILEAPDRLHLEVKTADFAQALEKATVIGKMADEQWHHPEIGVAFKKLQAEIYTHVIEGLREADFIFAAKVDHLLGLNKR